MVPARGGRREGLAEAVHRETWTTSTWRSFLGGDGWETMVVLQSFNGMFMGITEVQCDFIVSQWDLVEFSEWLSKIQQVLWHFYSDLDVFQWIFMVVELGCYSDKMVFDSDLGNVNGNC